MSDTLRQISGRRNRCLALAPHRICRACKCGAESPFTPGRRRESRPAARGSTARRRASRPTPRLQNETHASDILRPRKVLWRLRPQLVKSRHALRHRIAWSHGRKLPRADLFMPHGIRRPELSIKVVQCLFCHFRIPLSASCQHVKLWQKKNVACLISSRLTQGIGKRPFKNMKDETRYCDGQKPVVRLLGFLEGLFALKNRSNGFVIRHLAAT